MLSECVIRVILTQSCYEFWPASVWVWQICVANDVARTLIRTEFGWVLAHGID